MSQRKSVKIRVEGNPYARLNQKIKMVTRQIGTDGNPIIRERVEDGSGRQYDTYSTQSVDVESLSCLPGTAHIISPFNGKNGLLTGLDEMIDNPYMDLNSGEFYPEWGESVLKDKAKVSRQVLLEYEHNVPRNHYTSRVNNRVYGTEVPEGTPYFATSSCKLHMTNNTIVLDMANRDHELAYYWLKARTDVAPSYDALEKNRAIYKYVIADASEKSKNMHKKEKLSVVAAAALNNIDVLNDSTIILFAKVMGASVDISREDAFMYLKSKYENSAAEANEFILLHKHWSDLATRDTVIAKAQLADYVEANIIRKRDNKYFFNYTDESGSTRPFEWNSRDHIVKTFLLAPEFVEEVEYIKGKYNRYLDEKNYH